MKNMFLGVLLFFIGVPLYAGDMEYYSSITVYQCSEVAGNRVLHPEDPIKVPFEKRVAQEPTCEKKETFFTKNVKSIPYSIRSYLGNNGNGNILIIIQEKPFALPAKDTQA